MRCFRHNTTSGLGKKQIFDYTRAIPAVKAMALSEGYTEETINQVVQSLYWHAEQMKQVIFAQEDTRRSTKRSRVIESLL